MSENETDYGDCITRRVQMPPRPMTDASQEKLNRYRVEWRGKITRDAGFEEIEALDSDDARGWFEASYPERGVMAVSLIPATSK